MRATDTDALICDFTQYYHIMDPDSLDLQTAAILACGLPEESRIIKALSGQKYSFERILAMAAVDTLRSIEYAYYKTHSKGDAKKPKRLLMQALGMEEEQETQETVAFDTPEEFEAAKRKILGS